MKGLRAIWFGASLSRTNITLFALGWALLILYERGLFTLSSTGNIAGFISLALAQATLYFIGAWIVWRARPARSTLTLILVFAALFRLSILFAPPYLSSDIHRYVWDGRVQAAGINPYRHIPADEELAHLRDEKIYPQINRRDYAHTIYPPVAQMIFAGVTRISESVTWMKAAMVGFEAIAVWMLIQLLASFSMPRHYVMFYAWHPLLVWEVAGSGHVDAAVIAFVSAALLARRRNLEAATGIALACATLIKFVPVLLLPALYRRRGWKMLAAFAATIIIAYLPYLSVGAGVFGFLSGYSYEEGYETGERFFLLLIIQRILPGFGVPNSFYVIAAASILFALALWSLLKPERDERSYIRRACIIATAFILLMSPHYSWYYAWLVAFLCFVPAAPLFYITAASLVLYGFWFGEQPGDIIRLNALMYAPFALLCVVALWNYFVRSGNKRVRETADYLKEGLI